MNTNKDLNQMLKRGFFGVILVVAVVDILFSALILFKENRILSSIFMLVGVLIGVISLFYLYKHSKLTIDKKEDFLYKAKQIAVIFMIFNIVCALVFFIGSLATGANEYALSGIMFANASVFPTICGLIDKYLKRENLLKS